MTPGKGYYFAGVLHGLSAGLVAGWFLNSGYAFGGSTRDGAIGAVAASLIGLGFSYYRRATRLDADAARRGAV